MKKERCRRYSLSATARLPLCRLNGTAGRVKQDAGGLIHYHGIYLISAAILSDKPGPHLHVPEDLIPKTLDSDSRTNHCTYRLRGDQIQELIPNLRWSRLDVEPN